MSKNRIILKKGTELDYLTVNDKINDARQIISINESSTLEFQLEMHSRKWSYFEGGMTAEVNDRVYCIWGEDSIGRSRDLSGTHLPVKLKEIWYKLSKKYITAYNIDIATSAEFDHIDQHMVVLLGNSPDPLYVNGASVTNPYTIGTAPYMFYSVLYGSGWSLDARYASYWPDGVFDLETDKKSVLDNIELLQDFYGGMLFWDSKNMRIALVDEEKYQTYEGYNIRYGKNIVGIERKDNRNIITRLYPYGNSSLNIAAVNNGKEYIDNFTHTTEVLEDILTNANIYTQESLLAWGKRQSAIYAKPRYTYSVDIYKYSDANNVAIPQPELGKLARVFDAEVAGDPVNQRILKIDQNVFVEHDCNITVGDVIRTFEGTYRDIESAANVTNNTVSDSGQVSGSVVRGKTPALISAENEINSTITKTESILRSEIVSVDGNLRTVITQTASDIRTEAYNTEQGLRSTISQTAGQIRSEVANVEQGLYSSITQTASSIRSEVSNINSNLQSSITQQANRISLVVEGTGTAAKIRPAQIVASINNATLSSSVLISADRVQISGTTTFSSWIRSGTTSIDGGKIYTNSITASQIAANAITASEIKSGTITATQIASGAITADKIAAGAITADRLSADAVTSKFTSSTSINVGSIKFSSAISSVSNSAVITTRKLQVDGNGLYYGGTQVKWIAPGSATMVLGR